MRTFLHLTPVALLSFVGACSTNLKERRVTIESFSLVVPHEVKVAKTTEAEDFTVYTFSKQDSALLHLYVGNAPDFPKLKGSTQTTTVASYAGKPAQEIRVSSKRGNSREILITLADSGWPRFIHVWCDDLKQAESGIANEIIASLRQRDRAEP
jgi:hypothetical protein